MIPVGVTTWLLLVWVHSHFEVVVPSIINEDECKRLAHIIGGDGYQPGYEEFYQCVPYKTMQAWKP